nr:MAG TPA_asm: hypothetical protein [Bacteriophage sp.]
MHGCAYFISSFKNPFSNILNTLSYLRRIEICHNLSYDRLTLSILVYH